MWRITAAAGLVALTGIAVLSMQTTPAHACTPSTSPAPPPTLIVEGRITSYETTPLGRVFEGDPYEVREDMKLDVDLVLLGSIDAETLDISRPAWIPDAPGGSCGAPAVNLEGRYVVLILWDSGDGTYGLGSSLYVGESPTGEEYETALQGVRELLTLPSTGTGLASRTTTNHFVVAVAALGTALLAASFAIRFGTGREI